jgi:ankyrin repeat protein
MEARIAGGWAVSRRRGLERWATAALLIAVAAAIGGAVYAHAYFERLDRALGHALDKGDFAAVKKLVSRGASLNPKHGMHLTPLILAVQAGDLALAREWIARGAEVNPQTDCGTPLGAATRRGSPAMIRLLLSEGADLEAEDGLLYPESALMIAAYRNLETVRILVVAGANVNHATWNGETPLIAALRAGNLDVVRFLLARGANVNYSTPYHGPALVCEAGGTRALDPSYSYGGPERPSFVRLLLDHGASVNSTDATGRTALMAAAEAGFTRNIRLLLARGARLDLRDAKGHTALDHARAAHQAAAARLLRAAEAAQRRAAPPGTAPTSAARP